MKRVLLVTVLTGFLAMTPLTARAVSEDTFYAQVNEMRRAENADQQAIIAYVEKVLSETPDASPKMRAMGMAAIGEAYGKLGEVDKGIDLCRESLKVQETDFTYFQLSNLALAQKNYHGAINYLEKSLELDDSPEKQQLVQKQIKHLQNKFLTLTPKQLYAAFDENEVAAEDQYKGKPIFIKGNVSSITTDAAGYPVVSFNVDNIGLAKVNCVFSKENRTMVAKFKKGQSVVIPGTCAGMTMGQVFLRNCTI